MRININYETAKERHPEAVEQIVKKLRSGKSKHKDDEPSTLNWHYSYCIAVKGYSGTEFIEKVLTPMAQGKEPEHEPKPETVEEMVAERLSAVRISLSADKGRWWASGVNLEDYRPLEMIDEFKKQAQEQLDEQHRVDNLTEEEKQAEFEEALKQLQGSPGFIGISFGN